MKIAVVVSTFPPYRGGIGNVAYHDALALAKLGHQIEVFTPDYGQRSNFNEFQVHYLKPLFKSGQGAVLWGLSKKLKAGNFDIVHLHYPNFTGGESVWWGKKTKRIKKLVLHYHMDLVAHGWKSLVFKLHTKLIMPLIVKSADKVIVTSLDYGRQSNIARLEDKLAEVPNGVDAKLFLPAKKDTELLAKYDLTGKKVIGFVGALDKAHYFKGVEVLLKAIKFINQDFRLLIVGDGDLKKYYQDLADKEKVIFAGFVKDDDLPKYYNMTDILVLPSTDKSEAFGMVLLEAMACGVPVMASDLPGVRTVADVLVKPGDEKDLAEKINQVLASQHSKESIRKKVEVKYDWEIIGQKLEQIYEALLN